MGQRKIGHSIIMEYSLENKIIIGVDFGGTKILTGAMTRDGKIIGEPVKIATKSSEPADVILDSIRSAVIDVMRNCGAKIDDIKGIGLGVTGPLDISNGTILECPQLPTMHFFPLRKRIGELFNVPVYMNNDANCLIYAEALFGAGKGKNNVVGFTLGTGLGCAIILNGKIFSGATESAGEIWTSAYGNGIIEDFISGAGVSELYKSFSGKEKTSLEIARLAEQGDRDALSAWSEFGRHLSVAVSWTINLIDPDVLILGGSIANAYKFFSASLEQNLFGKICPVPKEKTKIVCAELGGNAGLIGAAALAL
jgi:glucokinase